MVRYRMKPNAGAHYLGDGAKVAPGDVINCLPEDLGGARDKFDALDPEPGPERFAPTVGLKAKSKGHGRWDVINQATGQKVNDKPLTKEQAHDMATAPYTPNVEDGADDDVADADAEED